MLADQPPMIVRAELLNRLQLSLFLHVFYRTAHFPNVCHGSCTLGFTLEEIPHLGVVSHMPPSFLQCSDRRSRD
jgi:hypothetical protein